MASAITGVRIGDRSLPKIFLLKLKYPYLARTGDRCHLAVDPSRQFRVVGVIPENKSCNEMLRLVELRTGDIAFWHTKQLVKVNEK